MTRSVRQLSNGKLTNDWQRFLKLRIATLAALLMVWMVVMR